MKSIPIIALMLLTLDVAAGEGKQKIRIDLPDEFAATAQPNPVERRFWTRSKEPMKFGAFQVVDHHRGWRKESSRSSNVAPPWVPTSVEATESKWKDRFEFTLREGSVELARCECAIRGHSEGFAAHDTEVATDVEETLTCQITLSDGASPWILEVETTGGIENFRLVTDGTLSNDEQKFDIEAIDRMAGSNFRLPAAIGFQIVSGHRTVAAVDLTGRGTVYLPDDSMTARPIIATAAAAMLLRE